MSIILNVDDCETNRLIVRTLLEKFCKKIGEDFIIIDCVDGEDAIKQYKICTNSGYDVCLIITDYNMPIKSGTQVVEEIKKLGYKNKIVILTALKKELVEPNEADEVIEKPFTKQLADALLETDCCRECDGGPDCRRLKNV